MFASDRATCALATSSQQCDGRQQTGHPNPGISLCHPDLRSQTPAATDLHISTGSVELEGHPDRGPSSEWPRLGVGWPHGLLLDGDAALVHGERLRVAPRALQQDRQVVEAGRNLWVRAPQRGLPHLQHLRSPGRVMLQSAARWALRLSDAWRRMTKLWHVRVPCTNSICRVWRTLSIGKVSKGLQAAAGGERTVL